MTNLRHFEKQWLLFSHISIQRLNLFSIKVYFSIDITAFPNLDPSHKEFTSDHTLNLRWYDPRLIFRDLNNKTTFNKLDSKSKKYIWKPQLAFLNALGPTTEEQSLHDEFTSVTLNKENKAYLDEDISLPREGKVPQIQLNEFIFLINNIHYTWTRQPMHINTYLISSSSALWREKLHLVEKEIHSTIHLQL